MPPKEAGTVTPVTTVAGLMAPAWRGGMTENERFAGAAIELTDAMIVAGADDEAAIDPGTRPVGTVSGSCVVPPEVEIVPNVAGIVLPACKKDTTNEETFELFTPASVKVTVEPTGAATGVTERI